MDRQIETLRIRDRLIAGVRLTAVTLGLTVTGVVAESSNDVPTAEAAPFAEGGSPRIEDHVCGQGDGAANIIPGSRTSEVQPDGSIITYEMCRDTVAPPPPPKQEDPPSEDSLPPQSSNNSTTGSPQSSANKPKDTDGDGDPDNADNCLDIPNPSQEDTDQNGVGDDCSSDMDGDGVENPVEFVQGSNMRDTDTDDDGILDGAEEKDSDKDGVLDVLESNVLDADADGTSAQNDPNEANVNVPVIRQDKDGDGLDDSDACKDTALGCDPDPNDGPKGPNGDLDGDGVKNKVDEEPDTTAGAAVDEKGRKVNTTPTEEVATTTTQKVEKAKTAAVVPAVAGTSTTTANSSTAAQANNASIENVPDSAETNTVWIVVAGLGALAVVGGVLYWRRDQTQGPKTSGPAVA